MRFRLILLSSPEAAIWRRFSTQDEDRWIDALAFDDEHGKDGPDVLVARIDKVRIAGDKEAVLHWFGVGCRLIDLHLAGANALH